MIHWLCHQMMHSVGVSLPYGTFLPVPQAQTLISALILGGVAASGVLWWRSRCCSPVQGDVCVCIIWCRERERGRETVCVCVCVLDMLCCHVCPRISTLVLRLPLDRGLDGGTKCGGSLSHVPSRLCLKIYHGAVHCVFKCC